MLFFVYAGMGALAGGAAAKTAGYFSRVEEYDENDPEVKIARRNELISETYARSVGQNSQAAGHKLSRLGGAVFAFIYAIEPSLFDRKPGDVFSNPLPLISLAILTLGIGLVVFGAKSTNYGNSSLRKYLNHPEVQGRMEKAQARRVVEREEAELREMEEDQLYYRIQDEAAKKEI